MQRRHAPCWHWRLLYVRDLWPPQLSRLTVPVRSGNGTSCLCVVSPKTAGQLASSPFEFCEKFDGPGLLAGKISGKGSGSSASLEPVSLGQKRWTTCEPRRTQAVERHQSVSFHALHMRPRLAAMQATGLLHGCAGPPSYSWSLDGAYFWVASVALRSTSSTVGVSHPRIWRSHGRLPGSSYVRWLRGQQDQTDANRSSFCRASASSRASGRTRTVPLIAAKIFWQRVAPIKPSGRLRQAGLVGPGSAIGNWGWRGPQRQLESVPFPASLSLSNESNSGGCLAGDC
jgi:hypothetical protein